MRKINITLILALFLFRAIAQNPKKASAYFKKALSAQQDNHFKEADSLYTLSLCYTQGMNAYRNRAIVRKNISDYQGFCSDLFTASFMGDSISSEFYLSECIRTDTFFVTQTFKRSTREDFYYKLVFVKYSYENKQNYYRYTHDGKLDLGYEVNNNDTTYMYTKKDQITSADTASIKYISAKIQYPQYEKENGIMGVVRARFYTDETGKIIKVFIVSAPSIGLANEVKRVALTLPPITPVKINGQSKKTFVEWPVNFVLR